MVDQVTIYDVASRAGVSITTVSHTLNRPQRVKADTRRRVFEAIDELGYFPKAIAMAHARKATGRIGVLAPFTSYTSYTRRLMGVMREAADDSTEVVVFDQESAASAEYPLLSSLPVTRRLDGLLIMGLPIDDVLAERLLAQGLPTVLVDSTRPELDSITIDDEVAGYLVGSHLIARGRRSFAYVSESQRSKAYLSQGQRRRAGLRRAIADADLDPRDVQEIHTTRDLAGGREALRRLIAQGRLPDAVFAHQDAVAAGVLMECRRDGIQVPDELAIAGFDDSDLSEALEITSVRQPLAESGQLGFRHLMEAIRGDHHSPRHVTLGVRLIPRATT